MKIVDDLLHAARFLMDDGFSLDAAESVRIGIALAELAGMISAEERHLADNEKERGTNA